MSKPRLLELFACQGGATAGYQAAGFDVYAVDLAKNALRYNPAEYKTVADALAVLDALLAGAPIYFDGRPVFAEDFDLIHASPPCQGYTRGNAGRETKWPKLIPAVRGRLVGLGVPYVIENVKDAGPEMVAPVGLCGCMFDLSTSDTDGETIHLQRLRLFETGRFTVTPPRGCDHSAHKWVAGAYGGARRDKYEAKYVRKGGYVPPDKEIVKRLLGVEHDMTWNGLFECIPPAYAERVGRSFLEAR